MRFGLFGINMYALGVDPEAAVRVAVAAEETGWDSVWAAEHYVLPDPRTETSPERPDTAMLDPFVALANVAANTTRLLLATGVTVVPMHQPLVLAKQIASVDRVSAGRFLFGVGVGYLEPEFRALGVPLADRGARAMEYLEAMQAIWTAAGPATYHGRYVSFEQVRAEPRPIQLPTPPVYYGGGVRQTFQRAVTRGRGWYGFALDPSATAQAVAALREAASEHHRPAELGPLEIAVTPHPKVTIDDATVDTYAELGVTRLVPMPPRAMRHDPDQIVHFVQTVGERYAAAAAS